MLHLEFWLRFEEIFVKRRITENCRFTNRNKLTFARSKIRRASNSFEGKLVRIFARFLEKTSSKLKIRINKTNTGSHRTKPSKGRRSFPRSETNTIKSRWKKR